MTGPLTPCSWLASLRASFDCRNEANDVGGLKADFWGRRVNHSGWFSYANSPYLRVNQSAVTNTAENDA